MNILIIGDSWGIPNYQTPSNKEEGPGTHVEWLLRNAGHNVYNLSNGGQYNILSATKAYFFCEHKLMEPLDYLIWFQTEALRERNPQEGTPDQFGGVNTKFKLADLIEETLLQSYYIFSKIKNMTKTKIIVIGGQAPVHDSIYDCFKPYHVIKDWKADILGIPLPETHFVAHYTNTVSRDRNEPFLHHPLNIDYDSNTRNKFIEDGMYVKEQVFKNKQLFPDQAHAGAIAHKQLFDKLTTEIF